MTERSKKQCIVLLPSGPYYERLFEEILVFAIIETGLVPSRLLRNAQSPVSINLFIDEIEQADALVADISVNTSEIWLAIGSAVALGIPLCIISSRQDSSPPSGIQHLPIIPYPAEAFPSDYTRLQQNITDHLLAYLPEPEFMQPDTDLNASFPPHVPAPELSDELVSYEVIALTIIDLKSSELGISPRELGLEMQTRNAAHLTSHAMNALRRRQFIERKPVQISQGNELHLSENLFITRAGQDWLIRHGKRATMHRSTTRIRESLLTNR
jgi:hypothetical protein